MFPRWGNKIISLGIMCFPGRGIHITRDMCFPGRGTHIARNMCFPGVGTHITRDMCFPGRGTHITRGIGPEKPVLEVTIKYVCIYVFLKYGNIYC